VKCKAFAVEILFLITLQVPLAMAKFTHFALAENLAHSPLEILPKVLVQIPQIPQNGRSL